jgi:hypothetical protein
MDNIGEETLELELTVLEINLILRVLGKHPFEEVVELVTKIKRQGEAQIEERLASQEKEQPSP